jgi:acetylornithine deacetylase
VATTGPLEEDRALVEALDEEALVELAVELVSISSPTGREWAMAERMAAVLGELGLAVGIQEVEEGRANVLGVLGGEGGGPSLMFNGHLDTSYSGQEPWLRGIPGFQPAGFVRDDRIYGLGISNMKGALACYVAAVGALRRAGVRLRGDVLVAAVAGEIEKTQWGDEFRGAEYRGYATGTRHLVTHGGAADVCILGEPTENRVVLAHFGTLWARISTAGPFVHTAFSSGRLHENSIVRMRDVLDAVLEWAPSWEERASFGSKPGLVNIGSLRGGFPWRVSRTPHRTDLFLDLRVPPSLPMAAARDAVGDLGRSLRARFPDHGIEWEVYVTAPGAEIEDGHPLVAAVDEAHAAVFGARPERDVVHWFSDASALTRYGVATLNYGTSSGLPDAELGENLAVEGLVETAKVYALAAARVCGVA